MSSHAECGPCQGLVVVNKKSHSCLLPELQTRRGSEALGAASAVIFWENA